MKIKLLFAIVAVATLNCYAQPGSLDLTFGTGGKVTTDFATSFDVGNSVAIQSDGKIVVAGFSIVGTAYSFALTRYNTNGSLDNTFGTGGKVTTTSFSSPYNVNSVAIQSDGKIVVAGEIKGSFTFDSDFGLARYQSSGALDNTFGSGGQTSTYIGNSYDSGNSVVIQSDGKIVVAGYGTQMGNQAFALTRYFSNGTLDPTFGTGGIFLTGPGVSGNYGKSAAIQSDGKIIVAGYASNGSTNDFGLIRVLSNGTIDSTFDLDGKVMTDFTSNDDRGNSVAIQSDGKIVVAGRSWAGLNIDYALARYNTDGSLDNTFGSSGKVTTPIGNADDIATSVAIQSDGKIVVAGYSQNLSDNDFALVRYLSNGTLDPTFGTGGKVTTPFGSADDNGNSVAIQSDGKIVVAGISNNGANNDFAVARYNGLLTGITENNMETDFTVYPNPFSTQTILQTGNPVKNATLTVYNYFGQTVKEIKNISGQTVVLSRDNLPSGLYFIRLTENNKTLAVDKLVITD